jgi:hypothetical protein
MTYLYLFNAGGLFFAMTYIRMAVRIVEGMIMKNTTRSSEIVFIELTFQFLVFLPFSAN